ncbi:tetratricopeptide repeat protein [Mesorhizobium sp. B2-4-6]|uniref:tetratricopeptide repeat protein n=1 Tax=Mesorhizobium sp. B2-4-6 TaxID=2589943 RepID=UPI00112EC3E0|nr:tetratricopeptide repeat protein [Mesorhizobium sp. B2-4-6]TPL45366.1 tetratricopeptide repeat protein [Mesorhizobium sp. B2-4-6]
MVAEKHWSEKVIEILTSDTGDLRKLAAIAGRSPKAFYRGSDLSGADLRGQDLRGMDFRGANLSNVLLDKNTRIDSTTLSEALFPESLDGPLVSERNLGEHRLSDHEVGQTLKSPPKSELDLSTLITFSNDLIRRGEYKAAIDLMYMYRSRYRHDREFVLALGAAFEKEHSVSAVALYREYIAEVGSDYDVVLRLAQTLIEQRDHHEAIHYLEMLQDVRPDDLATAIKLGNLLTAVGRIGEAVQLFETLVHRFPERGATWARLAKLLVYRGESEPAQSLLREASARFPESIDIFRVVVKAQARFKWPFDAIEQGILRGISTKNRPSFVREALKLGFKAEYRVPIAELVERFSLWEMERSLYKLVINEAIIERDFKKALNFANRWVEEADDRDILRARKEWAMTLLDAGNEAEAFDVLEELYSERLDDPAPAKWLSDAYIRAGQGESAVSILRRTVERFPGKSAPTKWYLEALVNTNRIVEALELWQSQDQDVFGKRTRELMSKIEARFREA